MCISTPIYMNVKTIAAVDLGLVHGGESYVLQDGQIAPVRSSMEVYMYRYTSLMVETAAAGWVRLSERGSSMYTGKLAKGNEAMRICVSRDSLPIPLGSGVNTASRLSESEANYLFNDAKTVKASSLEQVIPGLWYVSESGTETAWAVDLQEEVRVERLPLPMSILTAHEIMSLNSGNGKPAMLSSNAWQTMYKKIMKEIGVSLNNLYIGRPTPWVTGKEQELVRAEDYAAINPYRLTLEHEMDTKNPYDECLPMWGLGWILQEDVTALINAANGRIPEAGASNILY